MDSNVINAVVALVENRPKDAREILRSPGMKISSTELQARLERSLVKREREAIAAAMKDVLKRTLRVNVKAALGEKYNESLEESYLQGVAFVESILDEYITE